MYSLVFAAKAKRSLRKYKKSGIFPQEKFEAAVALLCVGKPLPPSYDDHALRGELVSFREFHLGYDLLVKYRRRAELQVINIVAIGTHSELFGG